jgi:Rrf2 family protein
MANSNAELHCVKTLLSKINIPPNYIRRIMTNLCKYKFVASVQGRDGGYRMLKSPEKIFIADIIEAVEGLDSYFGCFLGFPECSCDNPCAMHESWVDTLGVLMKTLKTTSLTDLYYKEVMKF